MCGILGYITSPDTAKPRRLITALLLQSKIRGLHATGVAYRASANQSIRSYRKPMPANDFINDAHWEHLWKLRPQQAIFHTRYSTSGDWQNNENNQPIVRNNRALVHNGIISMATKAEFCALYNVETYTENDSEILLATLNYTKGNLKLSLDRIHNVHPPIFACGLLNDDGKMYAFRDHIRPLWLWEVHSLKIRGFCSTQDIFLRAAEEVELPAHQYDLKPAEPYHVYCIQNGKSIKMSFSYPEDQKFYRPTGLHSGCDKNLLRNNVVKKDAALDYPHNPLRDFRKLEHRREGFIQYYAAEMLSDIDPAFPTMNEIFDRYELSLEQKYWVAFLYAVFYENASVFLMLQEFPELDKVDIPRLQRWHDAHWRDLQYQTDRRWNKGHFVEQVISYKKLIGDRTQNEFFRGLMYITADHSLFYKRQNFRRVWNECMTVYKMGRHSVYAWVETLIRCLGLPLECDSFFMADAESSRNGLCYALNREDLLTKHDVKVKGGGRLTGSEITWLERELEDLMDDLRKRWPKLPVDYMYVETVCCSYKGLFRNRRYLGYYIDRMAMEIKRGEKKMRDISAGVDWQVLWQIRSEIFMHEFLGELQMPAWYNIRKPLTEVFQKKGQLIHLGPIVKRGLAKLDGCVKP